jgi:hypothetical protein
MKQLFDKKNALGIALASLIISFVVFFVANFVLLGYERELSVVLELSPFALYAALVFFGLLKAERFIGVSLFSVAFLAACAMYLYIFADRNNSFASLIGTLNYIYIILIGSVVSLIIDLLITWTQKKKVN